MKLKIKISPIISTLVVLLVVFSCKKEVPEIPQSNSPIFEAKGTFDGQNISIIAGDNNVQMANEASQVNGINFWNGTLSNSEVSLSFGLLDGQIGLPVKPEDIFKQMTEVNFAKLPSTDLFYFSKDLFSNKEKIEKVTWFVNNAYYSTNVIALQNPGKYAICAQVEFTNGITKSICNQVVVGYKQNGDFQISYYQSQTGKINAWISNISQPIESIKWLRNGEVVSEQIELNSSVDYGDNELSVEVVFENGNIRRKNILIDGNLQGNFIHDFTYNYVNYTPSWDYKGIIEWKYKGETYSSLYATNSANKFTLTKLEPYLDATTGKKCFNATGILKANVAKNNTSPSKFLNINVTLSIQIN